MIISNLDILENDIKFYDSVINIMTIPEVIDIPDYYGNEDNNRTKSAELELITNSIYAYTLSAIHNKNQEHLVNTLFLLNKFITINKGYNKKSSQSNLSYVYKCSRITSSFILLRDFGLIYFTDLIQPIRDLLLNTQQYILNYYLPACRNIKDRFNNWGIWGLLGCYESYECLGDINNKSIIGQEAIKHVKHCTKKKFFISRENEVWPENLRNNYFQSYTYFYLSAALKLAYEYNFLIPYLEKPLERFYNTCITQDYPKRFPYTKLPSILGTIQQIIFPAGEELRVGTNLNWAGSLFKVAGLIYKNKEWQDWAKDNKEEGVNLFKYGELY